MEAIIYSRISQDRAGERAGVERQLDDCRRRCAERGWTVVAEHVDNDISAAGKRKRPGYEAVLRDLDEGRAGVVVAWALDRLARNRRDELRLYELARAREATISLVNGTDLDLSTAAGRFVADSLGSVARLEVELKSDRQRRASEQAAAAGRRVGGRRPFGYDADGMTVRPDEAAAVRAGYDALLAGVPLAAIARDWNGRGMATGQGSAWTGQTVGVVLRNPRNAGKRALRGEVVAEAAWPALVPEETWQAARAVLDQPGRRSGPMGGRRLLSGLALCGLCGATVHAGGGARAGVPNYRCSQSLGHFARMAEPVDEFVGAVVVERLSRPDAVELLVRSEASEDVAALRAEATAVRSRLDSLAVEFADGALTGGQLRTATTRLRERLDGLEARMADAGRVSVLGSLVGASDVGAAWEALDVDRRRAVIDALMWVKVHPPGRGTRTFRPETVGIEWKVGA